MLAPFARGGYRIARSLRAPAACRGFLVVLAAAMPTSACTFDSHGSGDSGLAASHSSTGHDGFTSSSLDPTTSSEQPATSANATVTSGDPGAQTTTDSQTNTGSGPDSEGMGSTSADDSGGLHSSTGSACDGSAGFSALMWAEDAMVEQMLWLEAANLPGQPYGVYSPDEGQGTITFEFEVTCTGTYFVWALVWDRFGGGTPNNPDSFHVQIDNGTETQWVYGCQTALGTDYAWSWQAIGGDYDSSTGCPDGVLAALFAPGMHRVRLRNREALATGDFNIASVVALVVSDDPDFDPSALYDPDA